MWALNLKYQFLHEVDELDIDHSNIRLFIRFCGISLFIHQSLPKDFHCLTCVGTQPMSACTARLGVYLPTPRWYLLARFWTATIQDLVVLPQILAPYSIIGQTRVI